MKTKSNAPPPELNLVASSVTFEAASVAGESPSPRRFSMVAYTGGPMQLSGWRYPVVVDLEGISLGKQRRPILLDHTRDVDFVIGQTDQLTVGNNQLLVNGQVLGDSPKAKQVVALNDKGFAWQASIGARAEQVEFLAEGKTAVVNGREVAGPVNIARRALLGEISFVVLGADDNTSAQISASQFHEDQAMEFSEWLAARDFDENKLSAGQRASLQALFEAGEEGREPVAPVNATTVTPPTIDPPVATYRAAAAAESRRIGAIRRLCKGKYLELEARAIEEGFTAERVELEVVRLERPKAPAMQADESRINAQSLEAALCMSAGLSAERVGEMYDERTMNAAVSRDLRGASIHTLIYEVIRASGGYVRPGRIDDDVIEMAFHANNRLIQAAGGFATISLGGVLSNVANKSMLEAYDAVNAVSTEICGTTDVNDFKQVTRYRMTSSGVFEKVGPDGELKSASLAEEAYTNQVDTFGRIIALTRQMIINDDLGAFLQIPRAIGRMSVLALEEAVFTLLLANPNNFFSVGNANYFEGADTALDIDSLTVAERMFLDRKDKNGKPILVEPGILLVPTGLKVLAEQLFKEIWLNQVPANNKAKAATNPHAGKFRPVCSPYLSLGSLAGASALAWYLLANPGDVAAIEIAYLRGRRVPTIESGETDFNTLGMKWRGYFDFGVGQQDSRAAVKSKGAA